MEMSSQIIEIPLGGHTPILYYGFGYFIKTKAVTILIGFKPMRKPRGEQKVCLIIPNHGTKFNLQGSGKFKNLHNKAF